MNTSSSLQSDKTPPQTQSRFKKWLFDLVVATVRRGQVPEHIAFILDGNRRWGRRRGHSVGHAYSAGSDQLRKYIELCSWCGVRAISVYAFSVENFKRSGEEVGTVLDILTRRLEELVQLSNNLGASIRICGQLELLSPAVQQAMCEAVEKTKQNKSVILNICFAYASTAEMQTAVQRSVRERLESQVAGAAPGSLSTNTVAALNKNMYTADSPRLDLLIRTGNTHRLSDFLLWQCHEDTTVVFVKATWPELSITRVLAILMEWRRSLVVLEKGRIS